MMIKVVIYKIKLNIDEENVKIKFAIIKTEKDQRKTEKEAKKHRKTKGK